MTRLIVCNECHEMKDHYAKGKCSRCYNRLYLKKYIKDNKKKLKFQQIARILNRRMKRMPFNQEEIWIERKCNVCKKPINPKSDTKGYYTSVKKTRTCTPCRKRGDK